MKILNRYVIREHIGPFLFAVTALTSLMLLQYIARQFGNLVGKGIGWEVILEFFLLSIPFTVAMTLPMAVLVAVLHAFSRFGAENEITALKAGGVSTRSLMNTVLIGATLLAIGMVGFNDQIMPWANHRLATLQLNIAVTKPTFLLKEQVINEVQPERLMLSAVHIDEPTAKMYDVTIHDVADPNRRRTIIADSGDIALAPNMRDITLVLWDGYMMSMPTRKKGEMDRLYFDVDNIRVRDATNQFQQTNSDSMMKGDREMTVCEMQREYERASGEWQRTKADLDETIWRANGSKGKQPEPFMLRREGGIGGVYCRFITWGAKKFSSVGPKAAGAQGLTVHAPALTRAPVAQANVDITIQKAELDRARLRRDRYGIEIQKKFSLAAACIVLAFVGAPIALRFPRGGVGLVIGVSFSIFALYYVCLIGGESLANKGYVTPVVAMWAANLIFFVVGVFLYARMGHEDSSTRGGELREKLSGLRRKLTGRSAVDAKAV